jgi:glycine hydroxymethyltransferase
MPIDENTNRSNSFWNMLQQGFYCLERQDPALAGMLNSEYARQAECLSLIASSSALHPSVIATTASNIANVTAEGYPGRRFHAGCQHVDTVEMLAIERGKQAFHAQYCNVQPHSASLANQTVMFSLLQPGDTILGMKLCCGGHLTHGASASISGRFLRAIHYGVDENGFLDYDQVRELAQKHSPKLIVCGATAYPRLIDFHRFRSIADEVGAYLLADITHIAGLVAAGLHPSPIDEAHFTTTCTHKQLYGPRGGLILMGRDAGRLMPGSKILADVIDNAVFPLMQGAPFPNLIAGKARALARLLEPQFAEVAVRIKNTAQWLAQELLRRDYDLICKGTDNHIVLVDLSKRKLTGAVAEQALEDCNILVNRNAVPRDCKPPRITSGIRFGTNTVAMRHMRMQEIAACADLIDEVLSNIIPLGDNSYNLDGFIKTRVRAEIKNLCMRHPICYN